MATTNDTPLKRCSKCGEEFPTTLDYFHRRRASKDGLSYICKPCNGAKARQWEIDNPERVKQYNKEYYAKNAEVIKKRTRNWYWDNHEYALQWFRDYYKANPERAERSKQWLLDNPDKVRAIKQAYIDRNPDRRRKQARDYHHNNHEKSLERGREYRRNHPENSRRYKHIRKARILLVEGTFTAQDLANLYEHQDGRCLYCGINIYWQIPGDIHVEHVIPISRGGANSPDNLALACADCNLSKGAKTPDEWFAMRGW